MGLLIPAISITPAPDSALFITVDVPAACNDLFLSASTLTSTPRLVVPPRPADCPSRRTLVQRGLRLGSYRLNCAESAQTTMSPAADRVSTRKAFNWTKSSSPLVGPTVPMSRPSSHRGHARTRSLNSFADWNDFSKANNIANVHAPRHLRTLDSSRPMSIDLTILSTMSSCSSSSRTPFSPTHDFACAL